MLHINLELAPVSLNKGVIYTFYFYKYQLHHFSTLTNHVIKSQRWRCS